MIKAKTKAKTGNLNCNESLPALVLHSVLGDSDYTNACICFPCHNKTLTAKLGLDIC